MVGAFYGRRKIFEASLVAPADIAFGDIVAARENSISDSSEVDFNIFGSDVDQHDFETTNSRINHHSADSAFRPASSRPRSSRLG